MVYHLDIDFNACSRGWKMRFFDRVAANEDYSVYMTTHVASIEQVHAAAAPIETPTAWPAGVSVDGLRVYERNADVAYGAWLLVRRRGLTLEVTLLEPVARDGILEGLVCANPEPLCVVDGFWMPADPPVQKWTSRQQIMAPLLGGHVAVDSETVWRVDYDHVVAFHEDPNLDWHFEKPQYRTKYFTLLDGVLVPTLEVGGDTVVVVLNSRNPYARSNLDRFLGFEMFLHPSPLTDGVLSRQGPLRTFIIPVCSGHFGAIADMGYFDEIDYWGEPSANMVFSSFYLHAGEPSSYPPQCSSFCLVSWYMLLVREEPDEIELCAMCPLPAGGRRAELNGLSKARTMINLPGPAPGLWNCNPGWSVTGSVKTRACKCIGDTVNISNFTSGLGTLLRVDYGERRSASPSPIREISFGGPEGSRVLFFSGILSEGVLYQTEVPFGDVTVIVVAVPYATLSPPPECRMRIVMEYLGQY